MTWPWIPGIRIKPRIDLVTEVIVEALFGIVFVKPQWQLSPVDRVEFHPTCYDVYTPRHNLKRCCYPVRIDFTVRVRGHQDATLPGQVACKIHG